MLLSVGFASFMSALDGSVVNALLPVIRIALRSTAAGIEWVVTVYLLVVSGFLLAFGRAGDAYGHRKVFLAGFLGFTVASALCALSPSVRWLIGFRALQGLAGAMLLANSPAILVTSFPASERGKALGLQATMTYLGLSVGPVLGGTLAVHFGWRSIFFINLPIGCAGLLLSRRSIAHDAPTSERTSFDWTGAALFFVGLVAVLIALNQGHAWGWAAPRTVLALGVGLATLWSFARVEAHKPDPMLDLAIFSNPAFTMSVLSAMACYVAIYSVLFVLPFYLIEARGLSPAQVGFVLSAQPLLMMIAAPIAGSLSDRFGARSPAVLGLTMLAAGLFLLSRIGVSTSMTHVVVALGLCGAGLGTFIPPNNSRLLGSAPRNRHGIASGILAAARTTGMMAGVAISGAVYTTVIARSGPGAIARGVAAAMIAAALVTMLGVVASSLGGDASA